MTTAARILYGAAFTTRPLIGEAWRRCWLEASLPYLGTASDVRPLLVAGMGTADGSLVVLVDSGAGTDPDLDALRTAGAMVVLLAPTVLSRPERAALRAGVDAMITVGDPLVVMRAALARLAEGESYASPTAARLLLDEHRHRLDDRRDPGTVVLSGRERAVLQAIVDGLTTKATALHLGISTKTVEAHRSRLYARLGVSSQSEAVTCALTDWRLLGPAPTSRPVRT